MNNNETRADRIRRLMDERARTRYNPSGRRACGECFRTGVHASWCDKTK